mgnify:CR=1 FL=1
MTPLSPTLLRTRNSRDAERVTKKESFRLLAGWLAWRGRGPARFYFWIAPYTVQDFSWICG